MSSIVLDRRQLIGVGAAAAGAAFLDTPASAAEPGGRYAFPKDFTWGCATAAYQIEGAVAADGRGRTNWDVFAHTPGRIAGGDTADIACDSYHRWRDDIALLKDLGVGAYRLSIAWARIFPDGRGAANAAGLAYYDRLIDALLAAGITPWVTLFHWDLPAALPGGWQNRDTAHAFADYAGFMTRHLADRVEHFMTVNELSCFTDLGHQVGIHAPGLKLPKAQVNQVRHHGVLAHGLGVQAVRAAGRHQTKVGIADNTSIFVPVIETPEHIVAAKRATREENAPFLTAIMEGRYIDSYLRDAGADAPVVKPGDMAAIGSATDFLALNVYTPSYVKADPEAKSGWTAIPHGPQSPHMAAPWLYVGPEVGYWAVRTVSDLWKPRAIVISENGCPTDDTLNAAGRDDDPDRIMYLRNYLGQFRRAAVEGYPLKGYFLWSLLDNFEWADGYSKRFGIHYVDFKTQKRTPKLSAHWYRELIRRNALV